METLLRTRASACVPDPALAEADVVSEPLGGLSVSLPLSLLHSWNTLFNTLIPIPSLLLFHVKIYPTAWLPPRDLSLDPLPCAHPACDPTQPATRPSQDINRTSTLPLDHSGSIARIILSGNCILLIWGESWGDRLYEARCRNNNRMYY